MTPRLESVWFRSSSAQYPRLAAVLDLTARRQCPGWTVNVAKIDPPARRAIDGSESTAANHHKLEHWTRKVVEAKDGARLLLVDADTFVAAPLDPLWAYDFDLAYTARDQGARFPFNSGVVAVRVSTSTRAFFTAWLLTDGVFLRDPRQRAPWRNRFGGQNQASFGATLDEWTRAPVEHAARIIALPCREWNCEDGSWHLYAPGTTRVVHVKSALRMAAFNQVASLKVRTLSRMWQALDREAQAQALPTQVAATR